MKAISTFLFLIFTFILIGFSSKANINFQAVEIESIIPKAQENNRFIFVEFSAEKCSPCVWMETNVFTDPQVARYFNVNFLSVKSNGISVASKFEKYKYSIEMFPTMMFLTPDGEEIIRIEGKTDAENLEKIARLVMEGNFEELKKIAPKKKEYVNPEPRNEDFPDFPDNPNRFKAQAIFKEK